MNPETKPRSIARLLLAVGGLIAWGAHFAILYGAQTAFCTAAPAGGSAASLRIGGLMLTAAVGAAVLAFSGRLRSRSQGSSHGDDIAGSERFLLQMSIASSALAALAMLWAILPLLLLSPCGPPA
jgi:hypothetical protein